MSNPLNEEKPASKINQVHHYARDLVYLVTEEGLKPQIVFELNMWAGPHDPTYKPENVNYERFREKWGKYATRGNGIYDLFHLMVAFGYAAAETAFSDAQLGHSEVFLLTLKAFDLLNKPVKPPSVFVSYRRIQSSTFSLLIEARLRIAGAERPVIDKNIPYGKEWEAWLKTEINKAENFVCLIGPKTLGATNGWVEQEIAWAVERGSRIISIWHGVDETNDHVYRPADAGERCPEVLLKKQFIQVLSEDAKGYEAAVNELLSALGYNTY